MLRIIEVNVKRVFMKVFWFTWKDRLHPLAGGAEVVSGEIIKRLVADGYEVEVITSGYSVDGVQAKAVDVLDGARVVRVGGRFSVYWFAYRHYVKNYKWYFWTSQKERERRRSARPDIVIEEINTVPFLTQLYVQSERHFLFFHQLAREIWFYQMVFPLSVIGYMLEPLYLRILSSSQVVTVSQSTKLDLQRYGFRHDRIDVVSEGISLVPHDDIRSLERSNTSTLLSLGNVRKMKRTLDIVKAFEIIKEDVPGAQLVIAGDASDGYGHKVMRYISRSKYAGDIQVLGRVSQEEKISLMQSSHALAVTSIKEGWGLVVTEANSQGLPAVVYNVDGLRDSVRDGETGIVCRENTPRSLAESLVPLLRWPEKTDTIGEQLGYQGWQLSKRITFEQCYRDFKKALGLSL